jgi:hypothetical protein
MAKDSKSESSFPWIFLTIASLIVLLVWSVVPLLIWRNLSLLGGLPQAGQIGDSFGVVNSLFSGLAFVGVVAAIRLQHTELKAQLEELRRTASANESLQTSQNKAVYAAAYKTALDILQTEKAIGARRYVHREIYDKKRKYPFTKRQIQAAEEVGRTFDAVGIMVSHGMLPSEVIADSWGNTLRKLWPAIEPMVLDFRVSRNAPELFDDFERLAKDAFAVERTRRS